MRLGWLGWRDLGFSNRDLGIRARNVSHVNTPVTGIFFLRENRFASATRWLGWHHFAMSAVFSISSVSHLAAIIQRQELTKL